METLFETMRRVADYTVGTLVVIGHMLVASRVEQRRANTAAR